MVMEATPTPSSVGREFVRQYYTLLNKAPTHLHRFYNHQSSFVHGGLDPPNRETAPVIGQKAIHQKIQQLGFRDCHAKITQVDSQATLGQGVVVQVTGELSNAGQPMRRFTQTFVLAAQSPKKFYVHNDIFRYQDEIINDEEYDGESRSEPEEDIVVVSSSTQDLQHHQPQQQQQQQQIVSEAVVSQQQQQMAPPPQSVAAASVAAAAAAPPPQPQMQYYNANVSAAPVPMQQQQQQQQQPQQQAATVLHHQQQQAPLPQPPQTQILPLQQPMQQVLASGLPPTVNGSVHPDELNVIQGGPPAVVSAAPPQLVSGAQILPAPAVVSAPPIAAANLVQPQPINNQQPPGVVQTSVAMAAAQSIEETANHQVVTESGAVAPPVPMVMEESSNERETINNYNNNSVMEQQQPIDAEPKEQHHHHQYRHDSQHVLSVVGDAPEPVRPAVTTPPTVAAPPAPVASAVSVEPKSWANLLKSGNSGGGSSSTYNSGSVPSQSFGSTAVQSMVGSGAPTQMPATIIPRTGSPPMGPRGDQSGMNSRNSLGRNPRPQQQQRPLNKDIGRGGPGRNSLNDDDDRKRSQSNSFTDVNQLFLGNLPHNATEDELREIFSEFGTILDLRIHSKPASKMAPAGMRAPPNFGFITYEAHIGVQACLAAKPIFYPRGDTSGTQLNVEEKRTNKDRQSFGGNGSGGGGGRLGNNNFNNDNRPPRENNGNNGSSGGIPNRRGGSMGPGSNARNSNSLGGGNTAGGGLGGGSGTTVGAPSNRTNNGYSGSNNRGGSGPPPNRGGGPNTYNSRR